MAQQAQTPFVANPHDELPVGLQLGWRLRALISSGRLEPGERMPSVRTLAQWAQVNVNTVRGVYARLEDEGLIVTRHGAGSFVADSAPRSPEIERIAAEAIDASRDAGVDPREVAIIALVSASLPEALEEGLPEEPPEDEEDQEPDLEVDELAARRELRRQIGRLEAQLAGYTRDIEAPDGPRRITPPEPRIVSAAELERTRDALLRQLGAARAAAARRARRERRAREVRDALVDDPAAHRWEVVSSADTGEEGCVTWQAEPRLGPLGALMSWWRVKVSGGCPLCRSPA